VEVTDFPCFSIELRWFREQTHLPNFVRFKIARIESSFLFVCWRHCLLCCSLQMFASQQDAQQFVNLFITATVPKIHFQWVILIFNKQNHYVLPEPLALLKLPKTSVFSMRASIFRTIDFICEKVDKKHFCLAIVKYTACLFY